MNRLIDAMDNPWKVPLEISRLVSYPYHRLYFFLLGIAWPRRLRLFGRPIIQKHRGSTIVIGREVQLNSSPQSNPISPNHPVILSTRTPSARLFIGNYCGITGGTLCSVESIELGKRVLIGANCIITDTDFHPLDPIRRQEDTKKGKSAPVKIEDDVFIGMNSLILKGVIIGKGSVIGAGSVITHEIPPGVKVAGNPARVIGTI